MSGGDLMWAFADARGKGFLMGGTAGKTTLAGEGLQHQDGHSLVLSSTVPTCHSYDPAYVYEIAVIAQDGMRRMYQAGEDRRSEEHTSELQSRQYLVCR